MSDRGAYRGIHTVLIDGPDYQALTSAARLVLLTLKLNLGPAGIDVLYPAILEDQTGYDARPIALALRELERADWIRRERNVCWIVEGLRHEPSRSLKNANHLQEIDGHLNALPRLGIVGTFRRHYGIGEPAQPTAPHGMGNGIPHGMGEHRVTEERKTEDRQTETERESGATSAPEPRSLALVRPESPTVLPALVDEPALPATRTRVARAKTPPRSGGEITAALSAWIDDTRAGAVHRQRADEERRNLAGVVFVYWQSVWQKPDAMLDDKREKLIVDRLRENGNNLDELLHAIDGGKRNTFAKGRGGALRLLLGDRGAVEEFAGEVGTRRLDAHPRADALRRALAPVVATPTEVVLHA